MPVEGFIIRASIDNSTILLTYTNRKSYLEGLPLNLLKASPCHATRLWTGPPYANDILFFRSEKENIRRKNSKTKQGLGN